jgi:hypothetical protein
MSPPTDRRGALRPRLRGSGAPCEEVAKRPEHSSDDRHDQGDLFAYADALARAASEEGMEGSRSADPDWFRRVLEWVWSMPAGHAFDADDIRAKFGRSTAAGAVIREASRKGYTRSVGVSRSKSTTRHAGLQLRWERLP